ncbi:MAG: MBL fold metallo-hydrolase, partial [Cytophagales bacterium]|nr:MBL fold metallo-hydrolase [Cytophagales bacterium]
PGCYSKEEENELVAFVDRSQLKVKYVLNTHCHIDHVLGNAFVKEKYQVPLYIHELDSSTLRSVQVYAPIYGFSNYRVSEPDFFLVEGEKLKVGKLTLDILFVPGHAPGHVAFVLERENCCIAGDVLFKSSIGRTDLPGGNFDTLIKSIHTKLFTLPDGMKVYPGHGPWTTIGEEKLHNPYCGVNA